MARNNGSQYTEITNDDSNKDNLSRNKFWDARSFFRSWSLMKVVMLGMVILLVGIIINQGVVEHNVEVEHLEHEQEVEANQYQESTTTTSNGTLRLTNNNNSNNHNNAAVPIQIPMPPGVNLGSWLSLEDYFFAGIHNSVEVATPSTRDTASKVAACLPPLHVGSTTGPKWHSETDLFQSLIEEGGAAHAIEVFAAHRSSFVDLSTDLTTLADLGITTVRIPMGWCLTDVDPRRTDLSSYDSDEDLLRDFACVDPFFGNNDDNNDDNNDNNSDEAPILWPAIPRALVEDLLRACSKAGLKASLDVHTYPGGTSIGTFSGVWPHWPRFWTHGGDGVSTRNANATTKGFNIGHDLFRDLVAWMEDLSVRDPAAFEGLRGISPMNEPAHLAGMFETATGDDDDTNDNQFLPPLPRDLADDFLKTLSSSNDGSEFESFPDGNHLRVFYWFQGALEIFRNSKLPSLGKEFQANIIESIFRPPLAKSSDDEDEDDDDDEESAILQDILTVKAIATWWCSDGGASTAQMTPTTTSPDERSDWAVLDLHHYHAWSESCSGTADGQDAAYACGDAERRNTVLEICTTWAPTFRKIVDEVCGTTAAPERLPSKLMSAEFSAASHHSVRRSCTDTSGLLDSYARQIAAGATADVELFYWSYQMPYGGSFKGAGWSFKELLFKFGVLPNPDTPNFDCDAHLFDDPEIPP